MADPLQRYRERRDPDRTPEPAGGEPRGGGEGPIFVVQEHDASTLHYDFRLEADGVLKSWAVPKGPSTDPSEKRLANPTEDHPLDYKDFEGAIPEGEYGAGTVIVWDTGRYEVLTEDDAGRPKPAAEAIAEGHIAVRLHGRKLRGGYALRRIAEGRDERWLLIKMRDDEADARRNPTSTEPESVLTGRTLDDVAAEEGTQEGGEDS
jgi:DNA ligase D-like protein (predicted 3'-phosphoesterase)